MIPYKLGVDCVSSIAWLESRGYMEWTKYLGVDTANLVERVYTSDEFIIMDAHSWNRETVSFDIYSMVRRTPHILRSEFFGI
jgi:hypothetical protein